mmetsp:Transcript_24739/g.93574  ORF Transcript_24739/g.93574 Transcript_24739/m.93574 type:complete len:215 (-) Transcript_24739:431-1075(-)
MASTCMSEAGALRSVLASSLDFGASAPPENTAILLLYRSTACRNASSTPAGCLAAPWPPCLWSAITAAEGQRPSSASARSTGPAFHSSRPWAPPEGDARTVTKKWAMNERLACWLAPACEGSCPTETRMTWPDWLCSTRTPFGSASSTLPAARRRAALRLARKPREAACSITASRMTRLARCALCFSCRDTNPATICPALVRSRSALRRAVRAS